MYVSLKYRIPGNSIVTEKGAFLVHKNLEDFSGFVVSDFLKKNLFAFHSGTAVNESIDIKPPAVLSREEYLTNGDKFLREIKELDLGKAVLSRIKKVSIKSSAKDKLFEALCIKYPNAFVYEIISHTLGHWIGATPEKLIEGRNQDFETVALASTKSADDITEWNEKEVAEQDMVTRFIEDELNQLCISFSLQNRSELIAGPVKHLRTKFTSIRGNDAMQLIDVLHPTPAVSGSPRFEAIDLIKRFEYHDRLLYTGFLGLIEETVNVYVNLRCLQIIGNNAYLYLGGGYTKDSVVENEWDETENKSKTLMEVIENL